MFGETTVNIGAAAADKLSLAAARRSMSRRDLVSALMKRAAARMETYSGTRVTARYQERQGGVEWRKLHVVMRRDEYDFFHDLKKLFKMSVSCIVGYAIEHFLDELIEEMDGVTDNYLYRNYAIIHYPIGDVMCWLICWGIHPALAHYLPPGPP